MLKYSLLIISIILLTGSTVTKTNAPLTCKEITTKTINTINNVERLKYSLKIIERGKKGFNNYESSVKLNRTPRKLYLYIKGVELLWIQGENNGKTLVNPNSFPYINLNLDPMGSLMRQDQHHTINEMGFDYFGDIIDYGMKKLGNKFDEYFKLEGEEKHNGRPCYKITVTNTDYEKTTYTVGTNETVTSIARKLKISKYRILELNPNLDGYNDILEKGKQIIVTNWYAKDVVMYIDQFYFLPIGVKVIDDKGLFEQYDYHYLQVNPKFEEDEFSKNYKDYKF